MRRPYGPMREKNRSVGATHALPCSREGISAFPPSSRQPAVTAVPLAVTINMLPPWPTTS